MLNLIAQNKPFGGGLTPPAGAGGLAGAASGANPLTSLESVISMLMGLVTVVASLLLLGYIVLGGVTWITAGGDSGKIEKARNKIVQGVIGLAVVVAAYALIGLVGKVIGIDILNPAATLKTIFNV